MPLTAPLTCLASWLPGRRLAQRYARGIDALIADLGSRDPRTREMARTRCSVWPTGLAATDDEGPCPVPGRYCCSLSRSQTMDPFVDRRTEWVMGLRDFLRRRSGKNDD